MDFLSLCHNISCERFESFASRLYNRYGHVTCLTFFYIPHDSGFARMRAADDFALGAVLQFSTDMGFHQEPRPHCTPKLQQLSSLARLPWEVG